MYIPVQYRETDMEKIKAFIRQNGFGTIVTTSDGKPIATHTPLMMRKIDGEDYITGHVAKANPQWKTLEGGNNNVLVMFQGPHSYVSSSWYKEEDVPTWNYQAVHVYGTSELLSEEALKEDLALLLAKYEKHRENPSLWNNLSPGTLKQIRGVVGFKINIEEVQAAYKLSQNRTEEDYLHIINKLYGEDDLNATQLADVMKKNK
ncbi:FMN-binding negative transcriptional regulator [Virgibacillus kimchii]